MKKSVVIPLIIMAVLLVAYLIMTQAEKKSLSVNEIGNFLAVDSGVVNKIQVSRIGSLVEFDKRGDNWEVLDRGKSYATEKGTVEQIADLSHNLKVGEVVSSNPDKQMLFQVDTIMGSRVTFYRDANELASVIVGKMGPDYQTTYVRRPDSKDVYAAEGNFMRYFGRPASGYRDKTMMTVDSTMITSIACKAKEFDYRIVHQDSLWRVEPGKGDAFAPDPQKMSTLLRQLVNVRCNSFVESDTVRPDFSQPTVQMEVALNDGSSRLLSFVPEAKDGKTFYAKSSTSDEIYTVGDYIVTGLVKKPEDLKVTPPTAAGQPH